MWPLEDFIKQGDLGFFEGNPNEKEIDEMLQSFDDYPYGDEYSQASDQQSSLVQRNGSLAPAEAPIQGPLQNVPPASPMKLDVKGKSNGEKLAELAFRNFK